MRPQTAAAATGTDIQRGTPNISMPEATPANSEKVVATLPMSSANIASAVRRMPKLSRISAEKPLPVTTPMRVAVVCTTISKMHMTGMIHSVM